MIKVLFFAQTRELVGIDALESMINSTMLKRFVLTWLKLVKVQKVQKVSGISPLSLVNCSLQ